MTALVALALAASTLPPLKLVFTGDNAGEVGPCGCKVNPTGGLARRAQVLVRPSDVPSLILDSGNALFRFASPPSTDDQRRAGFILSAMGRMGTLAMGVGPRDLAAGPGFLKAQSADAGVRPLSANLAQGGKALFEGSIAIERGGLRIGIVGVSGTGVSTAFPDLSVAPPLGAVLRERARLKADKVSLIVVLAAMPLVEALELSKGLASQVDVVVQSDDFRDGPPQVMGGVVLTSGGQRGRAVNALTLDGLTGKPGAAWTDASEAKAQAERALVLESRLRELEARAERATDAEARKQTLTLASELRRSRDQAQRDARRVNQGPRFSFERVDLDASVGEDPSLKQMAEAFEPPKR